MSFQWLIFAQAEAQSPFMEFVTKDWMFAVVLFAMTLAAATLVVWRIWLNYGAKTDMNLFMPKFQEVLAKEGVEGATKFCKAQPKTELIPQFFFPAALENYKNGIAAMRKAMANATDLDILPRLNFLLALILAIAKIATMVGLLFTIISMIGTFSELGKASAEGGGQSKASAQIGLALFATMLGLMTAIPLVFTYTMCKAWIHKYELNLKSYGFKLLTLLQAYKAGGAAAIAPMMPTAPAANNPKVVQAQVVK